MLKVFKYRPFSLSKVINPKVSGHGLVMYLNKTHNFEWCVARVDVRMDMCPQEIGLYTQNVSKSCRLTCQHG